MPKPKFPGQCSNWHQQYHLKIKFYQASFSNTLKMIELYNGLTWIAPSFLDALQIPFLLPLKFNWRQHSIPTMLAFGVVEKLYVIEDICTNLLAGYVDLSPYPLSFEKLETALWNRIVIVIPPTAHACFQIVCFEDWLPLMTGKLAALIGMNNLPVSFTLVR